MLTHLDTGLILISDGVGDGVAGDWGSRADPEPIVLRDGSSVVIRLLAAGDVAAIATWFASRFAGLDADTLYARLVVLLGRLDARTEPALAGVGRFEHESIMAFAADGVTVGIARYLRTGKPGSPEVTVTVADSWRGRGLASVLLERLAARARSVGIEQLSAICRASELGLIGWLSRLGATTVGPAVGGRVEIRIDLTEQEPEPRIAAADDRVDRAAL
jgi:GNAT superfamily N-acetyltransferase